MPVVINGTTGISGVDGSAGTPAFQGSDTNTGIRFGTDIVSLVTGGSDRLYIDSSGRVGIGTSSPTSLLDVFDPAGTIKLRTNAGTSTQLRFEQGTTFVGAVGFDNSAGCVYLNRYGDATQGIAVNSSGRVGIGTSSVDSPLHINAASYATASNGTVLLKSTTSASNDGSQLTFGTDAGRHAAIAGRTESGTIAGYLQLGTRGSSGDILERVRIDSSGRLLVGTSSGYAIFNNSTDNPKFQFRQTSGDPRGAAFIEDRADALGFDLFIAKSRGGSGTTIVNSGDQIGSIQFSAADGTNQVTAAEIRAYVDGTPGADDMPGRLVFSTTADGASSPTEAMRINNTGSVMIQTTQLSSTSDGCYFNSTTNSEFHQVLCNSTSSSGHANLYINRQASDGALIEFRQADVAEGSISVSGTTVTYGGGHLARWSQLPNDEDPSNILKGTIMSNLDEMCEWGEEDNEQLNKTKISDVEGDKNVAGVFVSTSFSDDGPLDFFVAMTGDMIIRIAADVTVERGDLLMSAGDGTAKPQGDGFVQDKTIAKVTSTHVTCTYDDGSYCVPCVLMAC